MHQINTLDVSDKHYSIDTEGWPLRIVKISKLTVFYYFVLFYGKCFFVKILFQTYNLMTKSKTRSLDVDSPVGWPNSLAKSSTPVLKILLNH